ncbi:response regulator [candidate division KSB1 bacterium]|nr:response regulator [candidate division KSB1 bacterium]
MKRILLIDDEAIHRLLYRQEFEAEGYEILEACCCETARAQLADGEIDLVILDILLPDGSCFELLEHIVLKRRAVPVIINTAYDTFRFDFKTWAADAFVVKSSDLTELKSKVKRLLDREKARTASVGTN